MPGQSLLLLPIGPIVHFVNPGLSVIIESFPAVCMICLFIDFWSQLEASTDIVLNYFLVLSGIFFKEIKKSLFSWNNIGTDKTTSKIPAST